MLGTDLVARQARSTVKSIMGGWMYTLGCHKLLLRDHATIISFHRVNDVTAGDGLTCATEMFEKRCRFFKRNFHVVSLSTLVDALVQGKRLHCELAITFDDGYLDNFENAAPVLRDLGLPATFFVVTNFIGTKTVPWWDSHLPERQPWMDWTHVRELHDHGFAIGCHTLSHQNLAEISRDHANEEIRVGRTALEDRISASVEHFAYPYGGKENITEEVRDLVREAGFRSCCSCHGGLTVTYQDPFRLTRVPLASWHESPQEFCLDVALRRA